MDLVKREKKEPHLEYGMKNYDFHRSRWETGDWTDDSDQMILILRSLLDNDGKVSLHVFISKAAIESLSRRRIRNSTCRWGCMIIVETIPSFFGTHVGRYELTLIKRAGKTRSMVLVTMHLNIKHATSSKNYF